MELTHSQTSQLLRKVHELEARIAQLECIIHTLTNSNSRILRDLELAFVLEEINKPHEILSGTRDLTFSQKLMLLRYEQSKNTHR